MSAYAKAGLDPESLLRYLKPLQGSAAFER